MSSCKWTIASYARNRTRFTEQWHPASPAADVDRGTRRRGLLAGLWHPASWAESTVLVESAGWEYVTASSETRHAHEVVEVLPLQVGGLAMEVGDEGARAVRGECGVVRR